MKNIEVQCYNFFKMCLFHIGIFLNSGNFVLRHNPPLFMLTFYQNEDIFYIVESENAISSLDQERLCWLFGGAFPSQELEIQGLFLGTRPTLVTPWSTNAVEITSNMGVTGIQRIEKFTRAEKNTFHDPMLTSIYTNLRQNMFEVDIIKEEIHLISDIHAYNQKEGLALSDDEVLYLQGVSKRIGRLLTDSEIFGFSQVNSEHCRHKIFNGTFEIDGEIKEKSLFQLIKETSKRNPNYIVSAYKDNVAFIDGPTIEQFAPARGDIADFYEKKSIPSVLSLKAETHNFPTTVEPFNGAATGSGGEIRDRMAGGQGSIPLAGTAIYMTSYPRLEKGRLHEEKNPERAWLYQNPLEILIKASNGASDFGNKFGQPLICGSLMTFEYFDNDKKYGFDKVIMLAGGVGYAHEKQALKKLPAKGDKIVLLGGDNYRIGMGGAAVSSTDTGAFSSAIELNAVQRSNPEMQKRVANTVRAMVESGSNTIISIHDHGAGGHLNCFSELVETAGGRINLDELPIGDPTLSYKEIIGNESQERMGLVISADDLPLLQKIADRERAPMYVVGEITGDHRFSFYSEKSGDKPLDLALADFFGNSPKYIMKDATVQTSFQEIDYNENDLEVYLKQVLQLESVACKDWLTNKVDRCVGGRVAKQQCTGIHQLPLNNCGVMALDYDSNLGIATSVGHAPASALIDPAAGSIQAITEALTNLVWAPLTNGLNGVSLSANWMWPCKNPGEDARLYKAVEACSQFAIELGINIPTGKDSLSMKQKYPDGEEVVSPGTVIISAMAECIDIRKVVEPNVTNESEKLYYLNWTKEEHFLGGSAFAQIRNFIGQNTPMAKDASYIKKCFEAIQEAILKGWVSAGHDISSGGLITTLCEMVFSSPFDGLTIQIPLQEDKIKFLFAENNGVVIQADQAIESFFSEKNIDFIHIASPHKKGMIQIEHRGGLQSFSTGELRKIWFTPSFLFDRHQSKNGKADERFKHFDDSPLSFEFPTFFTGIKPAMPAKKPVAAILREKGSNSERELANALYMAGFEVKDIHTTDVMSGRENLEDIQFLGAVGGFSNSDVLGSAKGWAGALKYNEKAKSALDAFFRRPDTLSVGICNGCQLFVELGLIYPEQKIHPSMQWNDSQKHESNFINVIVEKNNSVMMHNLAGSRLGVWISHGEGKFHLPGQKSDYHIVSTYAYHHYPANPNGSDYDAAMICSHDGRHLVMMPHIERSTFPWNWANYPGTNHKTKDEVSPWLQAFINAREWLNSRS